MKVQILLAFAVLLLTVGCRRIYAADDLSLPGRPNAITNFWSVPGFRKINDFVLRQKPELAAAKLTGLSTQVVAGKKYFITYETSTQKYLVTVFEQSWTNTLRIENFKVTKNLFPTRR